MRPIIPAVLEKVRGRSQESDSALLSRFARDQDEAAFAALVARHGPMVLSACSRVLGDRQAAEDSLQATFLVLARKAGSLPRPDQLAGWLYGVARRSALKARSLSRAPTTGLAEDKFPPGGRDPLAELSGRELLALLEEEVHRLPTGYRLAVVLCCLEGLTVEEAARRLNATPGSVRGQLERGRARLYDRLAARGLVPAAVLAIAVMAQAGYASTAGLRHLAVQSACRYASPAGAASGAIPAVPQQIADGVLNAMLLTKLKFAGFGLLTLVAFYGLGFGQSQPPAREVPPTEVAALTPRAPDPLLAALKAGPPDEVKGAKDRGTDKGGNPKHDGTVDKEGNPKVDGDFRDGDTDKDGGAKRSRGTDKDGGPKGGHDGDKADGHAGKRNGSRGEKGVRGDKGDKIEHVRVARSGK